MISTILPETPFMKKTSCFLHFLKKAADEGGGKNKLNQGRISPRIFSFSLNLHKLNTLISAREVPLLQQRKN